MAKSASETRASGKTVADEAAAQEVRSLDVVQPDGDPVDGGLTGGAVTRPEDAKMSMTPAFTRMRTDWNGPDREVVKQSQRGADAIIQQVFGEVYDIFFEVYQVVRDPLTGPGGEIVTDAYGVPEWRRTPGTNSYFEDWTRLGYRERENFLFKITTGIFRWTQFAADMWGEAMFARAQFEEAFSHGFESLEGERPTIDDRTARARKLSAEYRYHAVYASLLSRKADAIVRSIELLGQRIKDIHIER